MHDCAFGERRLRHRIPRPIDLNDGELHALEFGGGQAGEVLEVFAEGGLVGEVELVGYLLHVFAGESKEVFCFGDDELVNPLCGGAACLLFDYVGEVFG